MSHLVYSHFHADHIGASSIFGDDVVRHYANAARVEQDTYDAAVTCWERERYLERG